MNAIAPQNAPCSALPTIDLPDCRIFPQQLTRAAALIDQIREQGQASDRVLHQAFRAERKLGKRDRLILQTLVFFVLRHWRLLDTLLAPNPTSTLGRLGMALKCAGRLDERLSELTGVDTAVIASPLVMAADPVPALGMQFSLSDADSRRLIEAFGDAAAAVATALLERAPTDLRVNVGGGTRDEVLADLASTGIRGTPIPGLPLGIRIHDSAALTGLPSYRAGAFEIQDAGSQWITAACQAAEGQHVLDLCAGAGGKSLGLAQAVGTRGRILACDVDADRLARLPERSRRAGLNNIECLPIVSGKDPALTQRAPFDRVLVDAPCSGSGTFRRHPELKQADIDLAALCTTQSRLLDEGAMLTRPGGLLVYATCSLWREENEVQVMAFLARHPNWRLTALPEEISRHVETDPNGMARLRPDRQGSDGFFFAVLAAPRD
ncbi:hypothetical protein A9404_09375 [Halothiobacillus diazotrophicus]|uniref:SAM-dependent MTase RsmB/NOP-type domain-containing protein n=1 Tax=Halothiobacillus diazotrophicus TaxID=1860122 RepID=A0A191ZI94_9GAMM|nr:RsmB/NOP family class I SAM-dependent RNA methyltransferase [Halothiobacillus diazotrophicus]ANJ67572.1 hypothetical protein A9404_09375 [Halothiobacillus diazotrophicus]